jgi:hypothetical protein
MENDKHYQCTWTVRFCHPEAIKSYQEHPDVMALSRKLFRPLEDNTLSLFQQTVVASHTPYTVEYSLKMAY